MHRRPWVAWQRHAAEVIGEHDQFGRYRYPIVIVLVPRQCGKTTFVFDLALGRCVTHRNYQAAYTAQTGHVTTERFQERMSQVGGTLLARYVRTRRSAGTESIAVPSRGSLLKAFPPKDDALRGSALDLVVVDEAQEISEEQGRALDEMILPTFATRPRRQLILIGTAGTSRSGYLKRYLDDARAGKSGVALVEYGAPDDADPADEGLWAACHPGLAAGLTDLAAMRQALAAMGPAGFLREYLNVWTVGVQLSAVDMKAWERARVPSSRVPDRGAVLAFDISIDHGEASIGAAWRQSDGRVHVRLLESRPGYSWLVDRVEELARKLRAPVHYDQGGPAIHVGVELAARARLATKLEGLAVGDYAAACIGFAADVSAGALTHAGQAPLDLAAASADRRPIGDRWVWNRRSPALPVSSLIAVTVARHALIADPPKRKPVASMGAPGRLSLVPPPQD